MGVVNLKVSIDLDGIIEFNEDRADGWGSEKNPLDVADFTFITYSGDIETWRGHHEIITLTPDTTYQFEISLESASIPVMPIETQPFIKFDLVNKKAKKDWWNEIFETSEAITYDKKSIQLSLSDAAHIGVNTAELKTVSKDNFKENSNIQYSWLFIINTGDETVRYCQIDPYIKIRSRN